MNDLDDRLAALNPVRADEVLQASATADAARLLNRILDTPATIPSRRRARRPAWQARPWIAVGVAVTAAAAATAAIVATQPSPAASPGRAIAGFKSGPSVGVASSEIELVDYATQSAALAPVYVPGPYDWEYVESFYGPTVNGGRDSVGVQQDWRQVGTSSYAGSWNHGKLTYGSWAGTGSQLSGWPMSSMSDVYKYLASLPAQPAALRKILLANNHGDPAAAFTAVEGIFGNFPVPPRFQAELYAVLASLPGVGFTAHAVDPAGRTGIGLYVVQDGFLGAGDNRVKPARFLNEVIVNPRTYVYMGGLTIVVRAHIPYDTQLANPGTGTITEGVAILDSGIVGKPGQTP